MKRVKRNKLLMLGLLVLLLLLVRTGIYLTRTPSGQVLVAGGFTDELQATSSTRRWSEPSAPLGRRSRSSTLGSHGHQNQIGKALPFSPGKASSSTHVRCPKSFSFSAVDLPHGLYPGKGDVWTAGVLPLHPHLFPLRRDRGMSTRGLSRFVVSGRAYLAVQSFWTFGTRSCSGSHHTGQ